VLNGEFIADSPVCSGDSGGPALDSSGRVSGVTSRGDEQCTVGIYSGVSAWKDFIVEKTFTAAVSGHYSPPAWAGTPPPGFDPGITPTGGTSGGGTGPVVIAGGPAQPGGGSGGTSNASPIIDPLGLSCTGQCPGSYLCWAASGEPPGICVPQCSATQTMCPADFTCDTNLGACIRTADLPKASMKQGGGCSVAATGSSSGQGAGGAWLGLALFGALWRGRRATRPANGT
jgi:hypothetical protein